MKNDIFSLYEERGDLLERKAISEKYSTGWYLQSKLDEINEQIRLVEAITTRAHKYYFELQEQVELEAQHRDWLDEKKEQTWFIENHCIFGSPEWFNGIDEIQF